MSTKSHPIEQSRLYRLSTKKRLASLLQVNLPTLLMLARGDNYRTFTIRNESGKERIVEEPLGDLKQLQSRLHKLLQRIQPPPYLHSGVKGRSYVSNAREHLGGGRVLKTDVAKFYPSTTHHQVFIGFLREFRCAGDVAKILADLCTYQGHIPTGSPVSMLIAYFTHKQAFDNLYTRMLAKQITLTVYVDDITLSGVNVIRWHLCPIKKTFQSLGLTIHKNRFFRSGPASITGVIVNHNQLQLPNRRHQHIVQGIRSLASATTQPERHRIASTLNGQISEAANVDERCHARAVGYKRLIKELLAKPSQSSTPD